MLEASWGLTTPCQRHSKCFKCLISLQEWATSVASISSARGAVRQQLRAAPGLCWNCLNNVGWEKGTAGPLPSPYSIPLSSCRCRAGGASWASLTKKMPSMKSQEGNKHPAELCQLWPWGCRPLTWVKSSASSSTDQKDPAAPPIQATKLDIWS